MQRKQVSARMVKSIGWEDGTLEVEYISGLIHQYHDVSEDEFIRASIGSIDKKIRLIGKSHRFTKTSD
ncbi:KTSC domain-containing protein [Streptococcus henryi]|uniref:KTSC domain-containing protein n=1 Tax=Streptococcus henryi TaxID=439219 RepID=UPI000378CBF2|nr:KTSC domain-containing protein [Streptococcus henryi]